MTEQRTVEELAALIDDLLWRVRQLEVRMRDVEKDARRKREVK